MPLITTLEVARAVAPGAAQNAADSRTDLAHVRVRVVLYDPLADAGLYQAWEGNLLDVPTEVAASGVLCDVTSTTLVGGREQEEQRPITIPEWGVANADILFDEDNLAADSFVTITFPNFRPSEGHAALVSIHFEGDGEVTAGVRDAVTGDVVGDGHPGDEPHPRDAFRCRVDATYTIRIWLKPKTIVLHWSVSGRNPSIRSKAGRSYHFRVSEVAGTAHWLTGGSETDPRFWRHNLRIIGVPRVPGMDEVVIAANRRLETAPRPRLWQGDGNEPEPTGYAGHAGGFNTHSVAVSVEGMLDSTERLIDESRAMTDAQIDVLIPRVAELCRAWRIDATSAHELCTHFEVNFLHRGMNPPGKWDITWLPHGRQDAFSAAHGQLLCTDPVAPGRRPPANQPFQYRRYTDAPVAGFARDTTDRVSAHLRDLINTQATAP